jgi:tetratricopeptide (TPR) repeat protein
MDTIDIFLLYNQNNEEIALSISQYLTDIGFNVCRNQRSAISEREFSEYINTSEIIAIIIGKNFSKTISSDFVLRYSIKKPIVPILIPGSGLEDIPSALKSKQFLDLRDGIGSFSRLDIFIEIFENNREWEKRLSENLGNLKNPEFFVSSWNKDEFEIKKIWASIESETNINIIRFYRKLIDNPEICKNLEYLFNLAELFTDTNHINESITLLVFLEKQFKLKEDYRNLQRTLCELAWCSYLKGEYGKAFSILKDQEEICKKVTDLKERNDGLQKSFGYQAMIYEIQGNNDQAFSKFHDQQEICRNSGNKYWLQISLGNEGLLLRDLGKYDEAWKLFEEKERISREISNLQGLQWALNYKADFYINRKDLASAMKMYKEQEAICRKIGYNRGLILSQKGQERINNIRKNIGY